MLLDLATEIGITLKKTSNSKGGEYHSSCPSCNGGTDRFLVWPKVNRFWCRRCGVSGDAIQFCRNFMGISFQEAYKKVNGTSIGYQKTLKSAQETFITALEPPKEWQTKAKAFVEWSQKQLKGSLEVRESLYLRGLNDKTIDQFKLGYNSGSSAYTLKDFYRNRTYWGLHEEYKEDGKLKKLWLPTGIVVPTLSDSGAILKLKVRRQQWHQEDSLPKYVEISGSMLCPSVCGDSKHPVAIVVESELDALLIYQNTGDVCFCMALGGVSKKPDLKYDSLLRETRLILWCLDNDEAGRNVALWWRKTYSNLRFWPAPIGKSPGDAFKDHGVNLRNWIMKGIELYSKTDRLNENLEKEVFNYG